MPITPSARTTTATTGTLRLTLIVGAAAASLGVGLERSTVPVPWTSIGSGIAIEAAATLVALLAAYLAVGRFRQRSDHRELAVAYALFVLALSNATFGAIPAALRGAPTAEGFPALLATLTGAAFLALSGVLGPREVARTRRAWSTLLAVIVPAVMTVAAAGGVGIIADDLLLSAGVVTPVRALGEVIAASLFAIGAVGFARRTDGSGEDPVRWLAIACALAAAARVNYISVPASDIVLLSVGDLLRVACYATLAIGAAFEIRTYWTDRAEAAVIEERRRLARDLHDGLAQELAFIAMLAEDESQLRERDTQMRAIAGAAGRALEGSRRAIAALSHAAAEPFPVALRRTAEDMGRLNRSHLTLDIDPETEVSAPTHEMLLRIAREALTNSHRHADAEHISVHLHRDDGVRLKISDDGLGFDPTSPDQLPVAGFGLLNMREHADAIGARLRVTSNAYGTEVEVHLP